MPRRTKSPFPGPPSAILRWIPLEGEETHSPDAKMSEALTHFLDPLLAVDTSLDLESVRNLFTIGVVVWNLGSFEMPEWKGQSPIRGDPLDQLRALTTQPDAPEDLFQITEALLHRRRTIFGKDRRCVADFEILPDPETGFRLRCMWALPDSGGG